MKSYPIGTGDESTGVAAFHRISISSNEADGDATEHTLLFDNDPLCDCFQIGRAACGSNDFVIPGELHNGNDSLPSGPVSRRACRIVCERLPPFRCFIHAGGFSEQRVSNVSSYR